MTASGPEADIYAGLATLLGTEFVDLRKLYVSASTRAKVPAHVARDRRCVPFIFNRCRIVLAVDDPFHVVAGDFLEWSRWLGVAARRQLGFVLVTPSALDEYLDAHYPSEDPGAL